VLRKLLALSGYHDYLEAEGKEKGEAAERLANVDELVSAAREFDREHPGSSIVEFMEETSLASAVDRWRDEAGAVTLMTLHAAKGLEFPVVFIVGLEQGLLPHARSRDSRAELEEERRLLFVGITRAERALYLSHCAVREFRGQRQVTIPSIFLRELPDDALVVRDLSGSGRPRAQTLPGWGRSDSPPRPAVAPATFRLTTAAALAEMAAGAAPPAAGPPDLDAFQPGVLVVHPQYGIGRISAIEGAGPNRKGKVAFTIAGEKTFVLAKSPLRPVSRGTGSS
jgi:DNA helicase-2/ATP-dependent DNA helicase PcrA